MTQQATIKIEDKQYWVFTHEGIKFRIKFRKRHWREKTTRSRVYVDLPEDADDTVLDSLIKRDRGGTPDDDTKRRRKAMRSIAKAAMLKIPTETKLRYSIHAGCSMCPCSPGFIADVDLGGDLWVESVASIIMRRKEALRHDVNDARRAVRDAEKGVEKAKKEVVKAKQKLAKAEKRLAEDKKKAKKKKEKAA